MQCEESDCSDEFHKVTYNTVRFCIDMLFTLFSMTFNFIILPSSEFYLTNVLVCTDGHTGNLHLFDA